MNGDHSIRRLAFRSRMIVLALLLAAPATQVLADLKVGYVNAVRVIEEAPQGVAALKKLEAEFSQRDKGLVALQNRIRQLDEELQKNVPAQKETDRRARERESLALKRELKRATTEFREDYNQRRNEELAVLQQVVRKAILDIAKQEKYDLVLHEGTVYASDSIDITEKVLKKLGKQ
ncbi:MAG TPA: OmpH family outer membrane protein [Acidiferrobacterales bacterium]|nr:OmpH family outer membrane protein [Acidiferrobacterales bacterium]